MEPFSKDLRNAIAALECLIIDHENYALDTNAGDDAWDRIEELKRSRDNFKLVQSIYRG